jgi:Domain of unknown function (DUF4398)
MTTRTHRPISLLAAGLICFGLTACATTPVPTQPSILAAEQAIQAAENARVLDASSPELTLARNKLQAAHKAETEKRPLEANQLAEQARVQAELSVARASAAKAKTVNDDMKTSNSTLKTELQRNTGNQP